jgi:hypothetical protein
LTAADQESRIFLNLREKDQESAWDRLSWLSHVKQEQERLDDHQSCYFDNLVLVLVQMEL